MSPRIDAPRPARGTFSLVKLARAESTMDEARRLSSEAPRGAVLAEEQTAGRGRLPGRRWHSPPGLSLAVTFWLPLSDFEGAPPPLLAGLALRRALLGWAAAYRLSFPAGLRIKWPNDLLGRGKLAGILCEAAGRTALVGVGVNLGQTAFDPGYRGRPSSVLLETGAAPDKDELVALLADELQGLARMRDAWTDEINAALAYRGEPVSFKPGLGEGDAGETCAGVLLGVSPEGALVLASAGGERRFFSGELRPSDGSY